MVVLDNDCDGLADDQYVDENGQTLAQNTTVYYPDADDDNHGDMGSPTGYCVPPPDYVTLGDDCDDTNPGVNPSALETCATPDDENCDGNADEADAVGCNIYFYDNDGDGYGTTNSACLCAEQGYYTASVSGDLDDTDSSITDTAPTVQRVRFLALGDGGEGKPHPVSGIHRHGNGVCCQNGLPSRMRICPLSG